MFANWSDLQIRLLTLVLILAGVALLMRSI